MATMGPAKPKHMYSWWWDSHISPKNSKWLQENLTDMDAKVTQMIKLIEEDADSFARRAEMYYKKRPELMKMVEEFYRAYRALAERYDNATGVIRQAHRTMAEAFPNQVPPFQGDESPAASTTEGDPRTPDVSPFRLSHGLDESQKDAARHTSATKRNGTFSQETNTVKRGLKEFDDLLGSGGRARKGLNFQDEESHERDENDNGNHDPKGYVESERFSKAELEISALKNALSKLEAEKEASHLQYQQTLEKFSSLESEVSRMTKDSSRVGEQARKANEEAQHLKDTLAKLETEREDAMVQLQQYENKISNLEISLSHEQQGAAELHVRAGKAEAAADSLKQETARLEVEKESALLQHEQLMRKVSETEAKLLQAKEDARKAIEQAGKAESEAENLRQMLAKITEEKEAAAVQYLQCLETIAALERKLAVAEEEKQKLKLEMDDTVSKFKDAEEKCLLLERSNQSMHFAMESKSQEMAAQREELTVKQQELGVLWNSLQEERLRFVEAETAFQTLQHLHSQSQDELRSLAAEFQKQKQNLGDLEAYNRRLQTEVEHTTGENKGLNEVNLSSAITIQELQARISQLRDTITELEAEIELRVDQRNALQQEIYCLKEELNELKKNHQSFIEQVESVGFSPVSFLEDVKNLLDENMKLKEDCERGSGENAALMDKLVVINGLVEKNILLENSLSDLNVELEGVRDRVKELEKSCESLQSEKSSLSYETSTLVSQLHAANDHLGRASQKNSSLENSLLETRYELEALQVNVKGLQDSCSVLENEKSNLITEKESLILELDISYRKLESLNETFKELEEKHFSLEKDRKSMLHEVEGLKVCLGAERLAHEKFQVKSRALEDSNLLLQNEKSDLASAKESLILKLETSERELASLNANCRELVDKHFSLGKERESMLHELEGLKVCLGAERLEHEKLQAKSRSLEDFNLLLQNEKSVLAAAKESLVLKLETSERDLLNINARYRDLEKKHFSLEKESESMIQEAEGWKVCLGAERLEQEKLQVKSRSLEDFNLLLQNEKSDLAAAKESLVLKLETAERELASLNANYRELEEKHFSLGKERESMLHELEGFKVCLGGERLEHEKLQVKSRSLEDFNLLLQNEKSVLVAAKESLVLKLETSERDLLNLNARYRDLEKKHISLEKESESMIQEAEGLKVCLGAERLEHEKLQVKSRSLEDFHLLLQNEKSDLAAAKESLVLKLETAERDLASLDATYRVLEEKHFSLVKEREFMLHEADGLKASLAAEKHEHATLARISEAQLPLQISEMQEKLEHKSQEFDAELEEATNAQIEIFVMEKSIRRCVKKNFELLVEFQKLLEASQQSKKLISELQNEKVEQDTQTRSFSEQLNMLREGLSQVLKALDADQLVDDIEEEDKALLSLIVDKLKASQRVLFGLQDDKQKLVVENSLLLTLVRELQLEVATIVTAKTAVDQQFTAKCEQFLLLQASGQKLAETCEELKIKLKEKEQEEAAVKDELRSIQEQLLDLQGAHLNLRDENIKVLDDQRYLMKLVSDLRLEKHDLEEEYMSILTEAIFQGTVSSIFQGFVSESSMALKELSHDVDKAILENGDLKETAILMEGKKAELIQTIEEFKCKLEGLEVIRTDQATQIMKLYGECGQHRQQADSALEAIQQLEFELQRLQGNSVEMKRMADMLNNEVQAKAKEIIILESEAEALLGQLQISLFKEALLEGKIYDLADLCSHFEDKNHSSEIEIDQLRERVDIVDAENREIKSRVSTYAASFVALKDAIGELENHTTPKRALSEVYGNETKDSLVFEVESNLPFAASNSWELQTRIKAIEKAVIEKEKLLMLENSSLNSKLQAAMRQIEEERSPKETLQAVGTYEPVNAYPNGKELGSGRPKYSREIYEEGSEVITKDVMLDQVSEFSFHRISRRETKKEHSRERLSTDSLGEKEIGIDRLDISKHFSGSRQDGNDKIILERLDSDSGKLTSLELVIQDLKKKVEVAEKNNTKGKGIEYDSVKEQLEESEQAIQRISEMNQKLKKTIEEDPSAFDEKPASTIDQAGLMKRKRISEQARRGSEKVGRLQLEVQKLQYLLAKLDDETKSKVKAKAAEKKTSVLLRDFLHGGTRTGPRSKKGRFCSCVRPATSGD